MTSRGCCIASRVMWPGTPPSRAHHATACPSRLHLGAQKTDGCLGYHINGIRVELFMFGRLTQALNDVQPHRGLRVQPLASHSRGSHWDRTMTGLRVPRHRETLRRNATAEPEMVSAGASQNHPQPSFTMSGSGKCAS